MRISGVSLAEFKAITRRVSMDKYDGNLYVHADAQDDNGKRRGRCHGRLTVIDSHGPGARRSASGRHGPWACWHAYRDVLHALFIAVPDALVVTGLARYNGRAGFFAHYPATAETNIGSMVYPAYMPDLCRCDDEADYDFHPALDQRLSTILRTDEDHGWSSSEDSFTQSFKKKEQDA